MWTSATYKEPFQSARFAGVNSTYTCHAEEITRYTLYSDEAFTFAEPLARLDVGLRKLLH